MSKAELARRLGIRPQSVEYMLKRKSIDTDTLYKVSVALDYDFASLYSIRKAQINLDKPQVIVQRPKAHLLVELDLEPADLQKLDLAERIRALLSASDK